MGKAFSSDGADALDFLTACAAGFFWKLARKRSDALEGICAFPIAWFANLPQHSRAVVRSANATGVGRS
jgi:hypothetical protein